MGGGLLRFESKRIKIQGKEWSKFSYLLTVRAESADAPSLTLNLTVKYPFFYDFPFPINNFQMWRMLFNDIMEWAVLDKKKKINKDEIEEEKQNVMYAQSVMYDVI